MTGPPADAGWLLVTEHGAAVSPYTENVAEHPGVGRCVRSDGTGGPLADLVPDGWVLVDVGFEVTAGTGRDRVYLLRVPQAACTLEHVRPSRRWRVVGGRLTLDDGDGGPT